jgi:hypothetical protein
MGGAPGRWEEVIQDGGDVANRRMGGSDTGQEWKCGSDAQSGSGVEVTVGTGGMPTTGSADQNRTSRAEQNIQTRTEHPDQNVNTQKPARQVNLQCYPLIRV